MTQRALVCTCGAGYVCVAHTENQAAAMSEPWERAHRKLGHRPREATAEIVAPVVGVQGPVAATIRAQTRGGRQS